MDSIDSTLIDALQRDCKEPLARLGERVGLSAPSVLERLRKLERRGVIRGYQIDLDGRAVGLDVTAFIGVSVGIGSDLHTAESAVTAIRGVTECHHITGAHTLMLKVKTESTVTLERFIRELRAVPGIVQTETMVALSTTLERGPLAMPEPSAPKRRRKKRSGERPAVVPD
ncbi:MAG: Lrp/AsnC family transcriptional regulator [Myxococcales bacterium]|nr:Lrp/AsnC family transcriptional regulator [Myxococcales bacterium]